MEKNIRKAVSKVLNEQRFLKFIAKYGDDFFKKMFGSARVSKATISKLEDVFNNPNNLGKLKNGDEVIKLQSQKVNNVVTKPFVKLEDIQSDLNKLNDRLITKDEILKKYGPMKLQDGTPLSDIFLPKFSEKLKANLKVRLKPNLDFTEMKIAFKDGWKSQFPTLAGLKWGVRFISGGKLFSKLDDNDRKKALAWWILGVGDGPGITKILRDNYSIPDKFLLTMANTGGQLTKKWLILSSALTFINAFVNAMPDFNKVPNESDLEAAGRRIWRNAVLINPLMVSPGYFLGMKIIVPLFAGGLGQKDFMKEVNKWSLNLNTITDKIESASNSIPKREKKVNVPIKKNTVTPPVDTNKQPEETW